MWTHNPLLALPMIALMLLGAGCLNEESEADALAPSSWFLSMEGERSWYAVIPYWKSGVEFGEVPERSTAWEKSRVWVQNAPLPVRLPNYPYHEDWEYYQGDDWIVWDVSVFPENAGGLPSDTEPVQFGDRTLGIRQSGVNTIYYWKGPTHLFEIIVYKGPTANLDAAFGGLIEQ